MKRFNRNKKYLTQKNFTAKLSTEKINVCVCACDMCVFMSKLKTLFVFIILLYKKQRQVLCNTN